MEVETPGLVITTLNPHSPKTTWCKDLYNYLSPVWNNRGNSDRTITSCTLHRQPGLLNRSKHRPGNDHHTDHVDRKILIGADLTHLLGNTKVKKKKKDSPVFQLDLSDSPQSMFRCPVQQPPQETLKTVRSLRLIRVPPLNPVRFCEAQNLYN